MSPNPPVTIQPLTPDFEAPHFRQALSRFAMGVTVITSFALGAQKGVLDSRVFVDQGGPFSATAPLRHPLP